MTIVSLVGVLYPGIWFVVINSICPEKVSPVKYTSSCSYYFKIIQKGLDET